MLKKEMNERIIFHLNDYFGSIGYNLKKSKEAISYIYPLRSGFQDIAITNSNYYDTHYLSFGYGKRIHDIEKVMIELEKCFEPNFFYLGKDSLTYAFSPRRILKQKTEKEIKEEKDVVGACTIIKKFTEDYAIPLFHFLEDLQSVDAHINGDKENFWLNDDNKNFGIFRFDVRRIVIAKLVKTSAEYKSFIAYLMEMEERRIDEIRKSDEKYKDLKNWFIPKIIDHLEDIIK